MYQKLFTHHRNQYAIPVVNYQMTNEVTIVGAGIAGIASAIRLAKLGHRVHVFESAAQPGGKLSQFELKGYRFDAGPSLFTLPNLVDELFTLCDKNPEDYFQYETLDSICHYFYEDGKQFVAYKSWEKFSDSLSNIANETEIEALKKQLQKAAFRYNITAPIFIEQSLHRFKNYLNRKTVKGLLNASKLNLIESMDQENRKRVSNPYLVQYLNRFATYNGSDPYRAPALLNMIPHLEQNLGSYFPKGGMYNIPKSLHKLACSMGVQFHFQHAVEEIVTEGNQISSVRVRNLETQEVFVRRSDIIVCNADVYNTYKFLLPKHKAPKKTLSQERSTSALVFYWGIRGSFPQLHLHNILFSADYQAEFRHLFQPGEPYNDPTIYINISAKCEPSDAPTGCENWFVMINVPSNIGQNWDDIAAKTKANILQKLKRILHQDIAPLIEVEEILDPVKIEQRTGSHGGSLYGTSSNNRFAAFLRHKNFSSSINGLYFCGGSVHPGGGIPLCLNSAKIVAQLVSEDLH